MFKWLFILVFFICGLLRFLKPGGAKSLLAENALIKHQLIILSRDNRRPRLTPWDRLFMACTAFFISARRLRKSAVVVQADTLLGFHRSLVKRKYSWLFSKKNRAKHGPPGPSKEVILLIVELKEKNPRFGYQKIADHVSRTLGFWVDKNIVKRVLDRYFKPSGSGPSWLLPLANSSNRLWSMDLFRCESVFLKTYWVMVVMDIFSRRLIGYGVHRGTLDGVAICRIFNQIRSRSLDAGPKQLVTDNDPLFEFVQWKANLRILEIESIKSIPDVPLSHPFIERLIGTTRREFLDCSFFWNGADLQRKLDFFAVYYNAGRPHQGLLGTTPNEKSSGRSFKLQAGSCYPVAYRWKPWCNGLFQTPIAA